MPVAKKIKRVHIESFSDLHAFVAQDEDESFIFRGVADAENHRLITSLGRYVDYKGRTPKSFEQRIFRLFKERALPHLRYQPKNDWEWLALAQHHGLPTRLLDWSYNPLVACYFAVEKEFNGDSAVYAFDARRTVMPESTSPFVVNEVAKFRPPHINERLIAQSGVFTVHPYPERPFEGPTNLKVGIIAAGSRKALKRDLYKFGINASTLFPGLDGLARDILWRHIHVH